jgi:hypothetical protein
MSEIGITRFPKISKPACEIFFLKVRKRKYLAVHSKDPTPYTQSLEEGKWEGSEEEAGGRRQEAGGRRQEAGGRRQEAGGRRQEAGGRRQEAAGGKRSQRRRQERVEGTYGTTDIESSTCVSAAKIYGTTRF